MSVQTQFSEEPTRRFRRISALVAAASALTGSPSLIDRLTNALSPEPGVRAVTDALRIIQSDQNSKNPQISVGEDEKGRPIVSVKKEGEQRLQIYGGLPSGENVREFIEEVYRDVSIVKKIGAYASALLLDAQLKTRVEEGE
ncbi:MAG: hypothetical protein QXE96_02175 [Candidatus Caldarchaeum sp.]|jgi:CRISPR type I-A-associated protein Csa5